MLRCAEILATSACYSEVDHVFHLGLSAWAHLGLLKIFEDADMDKETRKVKVQPIIKKVQVHFKVKEKALLMDAVYKRAYQALLGR